MKGEGGDEGKQEYKAGKTLHPGDQVDSDLQIKRKLFC